MKKKLSIFAVLILSAICLVSINIKNSYSKFTATANTELSLDFIAEPTYTYYFQVPPGWGGEVWSYMWDDDHKDSTGKSTTENATFPGIKLKCVDTSKNIYSYTIPSDIYHQYGKNPYTNIIFSNGSDATKKTVDVKIDDNINGEIFVPELYKPSNSNDVRIIGEGWEPCYIHIWGGTASQTSWPGKLIGSSDRDTSYISAKTYYTVLNTVQYKNVIFSQNGDSQTQDLNIPTMQDLTLINNGMNSYWVRKYYFGNWHVYSSWKKTGYNTWYNGDYKEFQKTVPSTF